MEEGRRWGSGGGGVTAAEGSGVSLPGVKHVSLVQGSVPRRQANNRPLSRDRGTFFSVRFRYLAFAALGFFGPFLSS